MSRRLLSGLAFGAWLLAGGAGWWKLWAYSYTPVADAPDLWPADTTIPRDLHRPTLVMFVHPQCSCSHASLQ